VSTSTIRQALEIALAEITPAIDTAYVGDDFEPVVDVPYQEVTFFFIEPDNAYVHQKFIQLGYMQVALLYPIMTGTAAISNRAEAIRSKFRSGSTFSGITINKTPDIQEAKKDGDRLRKNVFVPFSEIITEA
jgi:hypothetical protein